MDDVALRVLWQRGELLDVKRLIEILPYVRVPKHLRLRAEGVSGGTTSWDLRFAFMQILAGEIGDKVVEISAEDRRAIITNMNRMGCSIPSTAGRPKGLALKPSQLVFSDVYAMYAFCFRNKFEARQIRATARELDITLPPT
jgi:hypothetical protein